MASDREALIVDKLRTGAATLATAGKDWHVRVAVANLMRDAAEALAALAAPPSAPHDYAALADRLADFRFGSVLKPDGTERDPKEWLAFEPELMRALRDLAAPPSAQDDLHRTTQGLLEAANIRIRQLIAALEEAQATKGNQ